MTDRPPAPGVLSPPPERGRSTSEAGRVGVKLSRFNRTIVVTERVRRLRRNSTDVEMRLWQRLRNKQLGVSFRRQHPAGPYVLDFFCPVLRLAIELDGGQHATAQRQMQDDARSCWLAKRGVTVLRFWNTDVTANLAGVLESIAKTTVELQKQIEETPTRSAFALRATAGDLPLSGGGSRAVPRRDRRW